MGPRSKMMAIHPIHGYVIKPQEDLKTIKRNTRERNRVQTVNKGFDTLQRHVPTAAPIKKMSKVCVLQHAMEYIRNLCALLEQEPARPDSSCSQHQAASYSHQQQQLAPTLPPHQSYPYYSRAHPASPLNEPDRRHYASYHPAALESGYESNGYFSDSPTWHQATSTSSPTMQEKTHFSQKQVQSKARKKQVSQLVKSKKADSTTRKAESDGEEDDVLDAIAEWQEV